MQARSALFDLYGDHLKQYWPHRVAELCELHEPPLEQGMKERHEIYLILLMAIVFAYWNGLKNGRRVVTRRSYRACARQ